MKRLFTGLFALCALVFSSMVVAQGGEPAVDVSGQTKNRIVLVHGLLGFDSIFGDYFWKVQSNLKDIGAEFAPTPNLSATNSNENLGQELIAHLIAVRSGNEKFNCIGHSQGGLACRYAASERPDLIASVTTIGTPNFGSKAADLFEQDAQFLLDFGNALSFLINETSGNSNGTNDATAAMLSLTTAGATQFNNDHPQGVPSAYCRKDGARKVNGVGYFSIASYYNPLNVTHLWLTDLAEPVLAISSIAFDEKHDGLVAMCSMYLGKVLLDNVIMNHADQINGMYGQVGLATYDPIDMYKLVARELKNHGY